MDDLRPKYWLTMALIQLSGQGVVIDWAKIIFTKANLSF